MAETGAAAARLEDAFLGVATSSLSTEAAAAGSARRGESTTKAPTAPMASAPTATTATHGKELFLELADRVGVTTAIGVTGWYARTEATGSGVAVEPAGTSTVGAGGGRPEECGPPYVAGVSDDGAGCADDGAGVSEDGAGCIDDGENELGPRIDAAGPKERGATDAGPRS